MGQEISQQNKCNIGRRPQQPHPQQHQAQKYTHQNPQQNFAQHCNEKYTKRKNSFSYNSAQSIPAANSSNTHNKELLEKKPQYRASYPTPPNYEKPKLCKKLSVISNTSISTTSDYQHTSVGSSPPSKAESLYYDKLSKQSSNNYLGLQPHSQKHQRKNSQSTTDSGIYLSSTASSCRCSSSSAASICGSTTGSSTTTSCKSLDKQTNYLTHHLYIKSYLDILEEDEKARAHFKPARPGIRNYTPKILSDASLVSTPSTSAPVAGLSSATTKQRQSKLKDDPWI